MINLITNFKKTVFDKIFHINAEDVNKRTERINVTKKRIIYHKNELNLRYVYVNTKLKPMQVNNYSSVKFNFVSNKYEIPINNTLKIINIKNCILIKGVFLQKNRILGDEFILKQTINEKELYKISNVFLTAEQYDIFKNFEKVKNLKHNKESPEYSNYLDKRKKFKAINRLLSNDNKLHSRHFLGTGETLVCLKIMDNKLTFYVSLIHNDIYDSYVDKYLNGKDGVAKDYWKSDKLISILSKQSCAMSAKIYDSMLMSVQDFLVYLRNSKKDIILLSPNSEMLDKSKIFQFARYHNVSILRKLRNPFKLLMYPILQWDISGFVIMRFIRSTTYIVKKINLKFGDVNIFYLIDNLKKIRCINDYKYSMLLIQNVIGIDMLPMINTNKPNVISQINDVIRSYRTIVKRNPFTNYSIINNESDEYTKILDIEEFHVRIWEIMLNMRPLLHDVVAGHVKAIFNKANIPKDRYELLKDQTKKIEQYMLDTQTTTHI